MYYTLTMEGMNGPTYSIVYTDGNGAYTTFPADPTNPNYPAYQAWVDEGNVAQPFPGM